MTHGLFLFLQNSIMAWSWNALESKSYKTMVESLLAIDTGYLILVRDTSNYLCTWKIPFHVWTWNHTDVNPHKSEWKHWINERMTWVFEHILIIMSGKQSLNSVKLNTGVNRWGFMYAWLSQNRANKIHAVWMYSFPSFWNTAQQCFRSSVRALEVPF